MEINKKLKAYIPIADMLGESFGRKCEAVIHDLTIPENSVVYVANGIITNREIGQSFDHLVKQVILSKNFKNDYRANYTFYTNDGREIKSSTSIIRDDSDEVIGALCINFEIKDFRMLSTFLKDFFDDENDTKSEQNELQKMEEKTVSEIIDNLIDNIIGHVDVKKLKRKDNLELTRFMFDKGIFLAKGSIEKVAERLEISPVTVYSYLDQIKKDMKQ